MLAAPSRWLVPLRADPRAQIRLFAFHHAGGSSAVFRPWARELPDGVELFAVELPGRGTRMGEPLVDDPAILVREALVALRPALGRPFAFFGHSMGARLAFELACRLGARGAAPARLFTSAASAPGLGRRRERRAHWSDQELVRHLRALGGTPSILLEDREFMELALPVLRADLRAFENWPYVEAAPLECPITAFGGAADASISEQDLEGWAKHTSGPFCSRIFSGDHFYFVGRPKPLLDEIVTALGASRL